MPSVKTTPTARPATQGARALAPGGTRYGSLVATERLPVGRSEPAVADDVRRLGLAPEEHRALLEEGRREMAEWEAEHGPVTEAERAAFRAKWRAAAGAEWPA